jgi:Family of unknown function (DUF6508)
MSENAITRERVDALLAFLPLLGTPDERLEAEWHGTAQLDETGVLTTPYPAYPPEVMEFFRLAGQPCWSDYVYDPVAAGEMVRSDEAIATATLDQIKTMLTFCVRGERFSDGHWGVMIRQGRVGAILRRLQQLRGEVAGG